MAITKKLFHISIIIINLGLIQTPSYAGKHYAYQLCKTGEYQCLKVKKSWTWDNKFPSLRERELIKRLNRTNMPLFLHEIIAVPNNLDQLSHLDLSPLPYQQETKGKKLILVDLSLHAFAAYNQDGNLVHWGPISGGKQFCSSAKKEKCTTITGQFTITRKDNEECISYTYPQSTAGGAPMPYCMFFKGGYALHGSTLPGHHASHGCVRLLYDDAKWLNQHFVKIGKTKVIVKE